MNKKMILIGVVILVVILIGAFFVFDSSDSENSNEQVVADEQATSTATSSVVDSKTSAPVVKKISYEQALITYSDKRFQFDSLCQATPVQRVIKNNTEIMLDNRANVARSIYVDGVRHSLTAYGFKIVKLYSNNLPHTAIIDCGTGKNTAKIILN